MLEVKNLKKSFSGFVATNDVSFTVDAKQIFAIIGPNGAGKSTLFNLITGHLVPDTGTVVLEGRDITGVAPHKICRMGMARSFQRTNIFPKLTVYENIQAAHIAYGGQSLNMWGSCGDAVPRQDRGDAGVAGAGKRRRHDRGRTQPRRAKAGRTRHRPGRRALHSPARRADRRHERAGDARVHLAVGQDRPGARPDVACSPSTT